MKILITTVFFPPQNTIASQRPYSWACAWARAGHNVTVLTIEKDRDRNDLAPMPIEGFCVIEVPAGSLIRRLRGGRKQKREAVATSTGLRARFSDWLRRRGFLSSVRWPDVFDFWVPAAARRIPEETFDLIVSTFGPPASLAIGYRAKALNPKARWVCDFRDLWTDNHVYPGFWPLKYIERLAEYRYLAKADLITTVSEALANALRAKVSSSEKVAVFENGFRSGELARLSPESVFLKWPLGIGARAANPRLHLVYTGSLHPVQRNPRSLFAALARLSNEDRARFDIVLVGNRESFIDALVAEFSLASQVRSTGSLAWHDSLRYQRDADVLLFFEMQHEASRDGVLTGKLFEYLGSGRPIWTIGVDSTSTVGSLVEKNGAGRALGNDVDAITAELRNLLREGRAKNRETSRADDIVRKYDRDSIAERMLAWITR